MTQYWFLDKGLLALYLQEKRNGEAYEIIKKYVDSNIDVMRSLAALTESFKLQETEIEKLIYDAYVEVTADVEKALYHSKLYALLLKENDYEFIKALVRELDGNLKGEYILPFYEKRMVVAFEENDTATIVSIAKKIDANK